jgi:hypothetical protein
MSSVSALRPLPADAAPRLRAGRAVQPRILVVAAGVPILIVGASGAVEQRGRRRRGRSPAHEGAQPRARTQEATVRRLGPPTPPAAPGRPP